MSERLTPASAKKRIKELDLSMTDAAKKMGITRQTLYEHLGKKSLSDYFILLFEDKIGTKTKPAGDIRQFNAYGSVAIEVPLVNEYAYGGYSNGYSDPEYIEDLPKKPWFVDREPKGNYVSFEVRGDSMDDGSRDSYIAGDILLCREIARDLWKNSKLHIHKWDFVVVHKVEGIMLKRITAHNVEKGIIMLHSLNPQYPDFEVNLKDVAQIFNVVKVERKK